jgi:pyridoxine kinase
MADVITPNLTEACILLKKDPTKNYTLSEVKEMAKELTEKGPKHVVITGVLMDGKIDNVIAEKGEVTIISNELIKGNYSGTGDLIASTITAALINTNHTLKEIMIAAANFVGKSTYDAYQEKTDRNDGVPFEKHLLELMGDLL